MPQPKVLLSWSSGKDAAWSLHVLRQQQDVEVVGLLTTINRTFERVAMHAVREELLKTQAAATDLPLWKVDIPFPCPNEIYEKAMAEACTKAVAAGIEAIAFGDLFLEDVRDYRIQKLANTGLKPLFPLWGQNTTALASEMITSGLRATLTCIDPKVLDSAFAGRDFDTSLLAELPPTVDPCGEHGEFHSFAWDGPMFAHPVPIQRGETVERDGFVFTDLLPVKLK